MHNQIKYQNCPSCHTFCGSTYYSGHTLVTGDCHRHNHHGHNHCSPCTKSSSPNHPCVCNSCNTAYTHNCDNTCSDCNFNPQSNSYTPGCNSCETIESNGIIECNPITSCYDMPKCNTGCVEYYDANCVIAKNKDGNSENLQEILCQLYKEIKDLKDIINCLVSLHPSCGVCSISLNPITVS